MTISYVLSKVKEETPNTESNEELIGYINQIEWEIYREVILTHENDEEIEFNGYNGNTDFETTLLAVEPFSLLYIYYVQSMIYKKRLENNEFNNYNAMFNAALDDYKRWYNRTHRHVGLKNFRYFGV